MFFWQHHILLKQYLKVIWLYYQLKMKKSDYPGKWILHMPKIDFKNQVFHLVKTASVARHKISIKHNFRKNVSPWLERTRIAL